MSPASEVVVMVVAVVVVARKVAPDSRVKVHVHSSSCDLIQKSDDALEMKGSPYFVHSNKIDNLRCLVGAGILLWSPVSSVFQISARSPRR